MPPEPVSVIVAARNEADRIGSTLEALARAFPGAVVWVADDASSDGTGEEALRHGAKLISRGRPHGKGGNVTAAAEAMLSEIDPAPAAAPAGGPATAAAGASADESTSIGGRALVLLCDADLGESAARLAPLVDAVAGGGCDLAIAGFSKRVGGGFGVALGFSRWATRRLGGLELDAPISGQRAMTVAALRGLLPFAPRYGMETAMNIDAARAGVRVAEVELDLAHRATGRTLAGFVHRARQLLDFVRVYLSRMRG